MGGRRVRRWGGGAATVVVGLALLLTSAIATQWRAEAQPSSLAGFSAVGTLDADPYSTWYAQMNRDGICALLTGCLSATGNGGTWVFSMLVDVPGIGPQTLPVPVVVLRTVPYRSMDLSLKASGVVGTVDATVRAELTPAGAGTTVRLTVLRAATSGLAEAYVPQFIEQLQPVLQGQLQTLDNQQAGSGVRVAMKLSKGRKATAKVTVTAPTLTATAPAASGTVRIVVDRKVVCVTTLRRSQATCAFRKPARTTWVRAVVTGAFDNGYPIGTSATARYRP